MQKRRHQILENALFEPICILCGDLDVLASSADRSERLSELKSLTEDLYHLVAAVEALKRHNNEPT